jgi:hypothetical protein
MGEGEELRSLPIFSERAQRFARLLEEELRFESINSPVTIAEWRLLSLPMRELLGDLAATLIESLGQDVTAIQQAYFWFDELERVWKCEPHRYLNELTSCIEYSAELIELLAPVDVLQPRFLSARTCGQRYQDALFRVREARSHERNTIWTACRRATLMGVALWVCRGRYATLGAIRLQQRWLIRNLEDQLSQTNPEHQHEFQGLRRLLHWMDFENLAVASA